MADSVTRYEFPSDLSSYQQGHFMKIRIFPSQSKLSNNNIKEAPTVCLFIPGGGENGPLTWQTVHEYDDVKLTKLGTGAIGAITRMIPGGDLAAAVANKAGGAILGAARVMGQGTINPKVDVLYGNTELRQFQFNFFMAPQSEQEKDNMLTIVKLLRKYSSPEITLGNASGQTLTSGLWFVPPAEFIVTFHTILNTGSGSYAAENVNLPKIARCVLTRVDVDFVQQGEFSTFKDGAPTNLMLTLVFREMRVISQADIENGY